MALRILLAESVLCCFGTELLASFRTWQRYAGLLHAKQSYTRAEKGLQPLERRPGAWPEPVPVLYLTLAGVVEQQRVHTPDPAWDAFARILERCLEITFHELQGSALATADEEFLNGVDQFLLSLTGGPDYPVVVVLQDAQGGFR